MLVIMSCVYATFCMLFLNCLLWSWCRKRQRMMLQQDTFERQSSLNSNKTMRRSKSLLEQASCWERLGARMERGLQKVFAKWGMFCANWPLTVIVFGLLACTAMIAGIAKFSVITDPVDLWSSPQSRARQEKKYFDENFTLVSTTCCLA